jgi:hypothetical protein
VAQPGCLLDSAGATQPGGLDSGADLEGIGVLSLVCNTCLNVQNAPRNPRRQDALQMETRSTKVKHTHEG